MLFDKLILKIQKKFGVSKSEVNLLALILFGLILGNIILFFRKDGFNPEQRAELIHKLDSIANIQKTSFIGTDIYDKPDSLLALGDTIVKKSSPYPQKERKAAPGELVDLNAASKTELMKLPGIGSSTALRIIEYRQKHKFNNIEDLMNVPGIGPKKFEKIKPFLKITNIK
ncbi:MAG: helix-hairpin-helix domain-containing protein [Candidatus Kapabacteria bacterium]|nr:helix-hairpin-helix domain-containing protein [Candidatus Kapabacteria bacterium]